MLPMLLGFLSLIPYALIALFIAFTDYLDWHGRIEVLETKHPRLAKIVENRPLRLVLLLMVFGMLAVDLRENLKQIETEPFVIKVVAAPSADPGAVNPEIAKWKAKYEAIAGSPESPDSLRRRTLKLADDFARFRRERHDNHPPYAYPNSNDPNPSEERKKAIALAQKYDQETLDQYNHLYRDRFVGIIREYQAKGVPVAWLENTASNGNLVWVPPGSSWEGSPQDEFTLFRNFAYRVDEHDNLIVLTF